MAGSEDGSSLPLAREAFPSTIRLVASARLREAVLAPLVDDQDELDLLAEIESATSGRLIAEERGLGALSPDELVHGVPHARFINASFAYAKPRAQMRFNPANRGPIFSAKSPVEAMIEGGIPRMLETRQYIDALRGGL